MYVFFKEVKNCRRHPGKILVSCDISLYQVSQDIVTASFPFSSKDPWHDSWVLRVLDLGGGGGVGKGAGAVFTKCLSQVLGLTFV